MRIRKVYQGNLADNKIVNTASNSQVDTYSCNYLNNNFNEILKCKKVTFNNEWLICHKLYGGGLMVLVPILNPQKSYPTLNITSAEIYTTSGWISVSFIGAQTVTITHLYLRFDGTGLNLTEGNSYLMRLVGTVEV